MSGIGDLADADGDAIPDGCDVCDGDDAAGDSDGDGICDDIDTCIGDNSIDFDLDGVPDACDVCPLDNPDDSDGDGICDSNDICPGSDDLADADGDGIPNGCDSEECDGIDNDGDGFIDEGFPDSNGNGIADCVDTGLIDNDNDGYTNDVDCDDGNPAVYPGATEVCDGIDNDCDGLIDNDDPSVVGQTTYYADNDGDGFGDPDASVLSCSQPTGYVSDFSDCDDANGAVYPGATEVCDGIDNDCDGLIDDEDPSIIGLATYYADNDGDGFGDSDASVLSCSQPTGYVSDFSDCDDTNGAVYPGATEVCDGIDNDCDGLIDNEDPSIIGLATYYADNDGDGFGDPDASVLSCSQPIGYVSDFSDCDDTNADVYPGAIEICDGIDNNCDGSIDEGLSTDADGDGHYAVGSCLSPADDCDDNNADVYPGATEICDGIDNNCDGSIDEGLAIDADGDGHYAVGSCLSPADDCDDTNAAVYPGATEICDGIDNNCDGSIDEGLSTDADGDGHYAVGSCLSPADDCDDTNAAVYPGAAEICDGIDNNCDGSIDEGLSTDADGDGHYAVGSCLSPADDCDDNNADVYPGAAEICDGLDNNCNGLIDNDDPAIVGQSTYYADADGDGFGDPASTIQSCSQPFGYVIDATDCDDTNSNVYPGAAEICDGIDNNCDGSIDEGLATDADGDGHYAIGSCLSPADDCDDNNPAVYPGAAEICDGLDNNCNGLIDNDDPAIVGQSTYYADADGDGFGDPNNTVLSCSQPAGFVSDASDCDDTNSNVYPGAAEILYNGIDDDCDPSTLDSEDMDGDGYTSDIDCDDTDPSVNPGAVDIPDNGIDENCDGIDETENECSTAISGNLNINPAMSSNNKFIMETPDGIINMNDLANEDNDYSYVGMATSIKIKVKGNGKTLTVNGVDITLSANTRYEFTGDMLVSLVNTAPNNCANPNGFWWIDISGAMVCSFPDVESIEACSNNIWGILNINPSMASDNMFSMDTPNGTIDMEFLFDEGADYNYSGNASSVKIRVKGWGKLLWINGTCVWLQSNVLYEFTGDLAVCLYNTKSWSNWSKAKGHWWISISGSNICMTPELDLEKDAKAFTEAQSVSTDIVENIEVYPNPFVEFTRIDFTLTKKSKIQLIVLDVSGRLVKTINVDELASGHHSFTWDGTNNEGWKEPNGVFIIQLFTEESSNYVRVILNN